MSSTELSSHACSYWALFCMVATAMGGYAAAAEPVGAERMAAAVVQNDSGSVLALLQEEVAGGEEASEQALFWYGNALCEEGRWPEAVPFLTKALAKAPASLATARQLARASIWLKGAEAPLEAIQPAADAFPEDPVILTILGRIHYARMEFFMAGNGQQTDRSRASRAKMFESLNKAVEIDPSNAAAHRWLARGFYADDLISPTIRHLMLARGLEPLGYEGWFILGHCLTRMDEHGQAAEAFWGALNSIGSPPEGTWVSYAKELLASGRPEEAQRVLRAVFKLHPGNAHVRYWFGRASFDAGDYASALFGFREAYEVDSAYREECLFWSACCALELKQPETAIDLVEQAEKRSEGGVSAAARLHVRGRAELQLGQDKEAARDLHAALLKDPGDLIYAQWAIAAYKRIGDPYNIVNVALLSGRNGHADEAMAVLEAVPALGMETGRTDSNGKSYPGGLARHLVASRGILHEVRGEYRTASMLFKMAGLTGYKVAWAHLYANDAEAARTLFGGLLWSSRKGSAPRGAFGLAYLALLGADADEARKQADAMTLPEQEQMALSVRRWADALSGQTAGLDMVDRLGVYGSEFVGGLVVCGLIPGGALAEVSPPIRPGDVLKQVGDKSIWQARDLADLRAVEIGDQAVPILVKRGMSVFEVQANPGPAFTRSSVGQGKEADQ